LLIVLAAVSSGRPLEQGTELLAVHPETSGSRRTAA
jgi:hypothetical protein